MAKGDVSLSVIKRLPRYYRFLGEIKRAGIQRVSSGELSKKMGFTASQIRQDLNCFGGFGQQGCGYYVEQLFDERGKVLGVHEKAKRV
ncbi:MAG: redox-sensing transcriptional repressor Rex, partial [Lachnospiraceae bacterium]